MALETLAYFLRETKLPFLRHKDYLFLCPEPLLIRITP